MTKKLDPYLPKELLDITLSYLDMPTQYTVVKALADEDKLPSRVQYIADWHLCFLWGAARWARLSNHDIVAMEFRRPDVLFQCPDAETRTIVHSSSSKYYKKVGLVDAAATLAAQVAVQAQEQEDEDDAPLVVLKKDEDLVAKSAEIIRRILQNPHLQRTVFSKVVVFDFRNLSGYPLSPAYVPNELGLYFPNVTLVDLKPDFVVKQENYATLQGPVDLTPLSQLKRVDMRFSGVTRKHLLLPHAIDVDDDLCERDASELVSSGTWYSNLYVWICKVLSALGVLLGKLCD